MAADTAYPAIKMDTDIQEFFKGADMTRDDKQEARKMLTYLGWVEEVPVMKNPSPALGGVTVPVVATESLDDVELPNQGAYRVEMTDDSHGIFHLPYPAVGEEFFVNTHPYEWASIEITKLDSRLSIDFSGDVPVMEEADAIDRLRNAIYIHDTNLEQRNLLVRAVRDAGGDINEMAQALDLSKFRVYQILQKTEMWDAAEGDYPTSIDALRVHRETVDTAFQEREDMLAFLLERGVVLGVVARVMGISSQRVKTIYDRRIARLNADA